MPTKWEYTKDYLNTKIFARFSPAVSIPDQDQRRIYPGALQKCASDHPGLPSDCRVRLQTGQTGPRQCRFHLVSAVRAFARLAENVDYLVAFGHY